MIRMIQPVTAAHSLDGERMRTGALLELMDIATCASAEKHAGVNCVTVAMGDVVFESKPKIGVILELVAEPVLVVRRHHFLPLRIRPFTQDHGCYPCNHVTHLGTNIIGDRLEGDG